MRATPCGALLGGGLIFTQRVNTIRSSKNASLAATAWAAVSRSMFRGFLSVFHKQQLAVGEDMTTIRRMVGVTNRASFRFFVTRLFRFFTECPNLQTYNSLQTYIRHKEFKEDVLQSQP